MRHLFPAISLSILLSLGTLSAAWGADYQKGLTAYQSGDFATALREWTPLAEQGSAGIQNNLGVMYERGKGVPRDYKTAVKWYTLAAEQGTADAQSNLGVMYDRGLGVPKDYKTAVKYFTLAAEQRHFRSQYNLGVMYALGKGVLKDYVYAHMWGNIAATNGNKQGAELRNFVEKKMPPAAVSAATKLARECTRKKYKDC